MSLAIELRKAGFKEGQWFCKEFTDNGKASSKAIVEMETIKEELQEGVLYGAYGEGRILKEYTFASLERGETGGSATRDNQNLQKRREALIFTA